MFGNLCVGQRQAPGRFLRTDLPQHRSLDSFGNACSDAKWWLNVERLENAMVRLQEIAVLEPTWMCIRIHRCVAEYISKPPFLQNYLLYVILSAHRLTTPCGKFSSVQISNLLTFHNMTSTISTFFQVTRPASEGSLPSSYFSILSPSLLNDSESISPN